MSDIDSVINSLSEDELDTLNSDPQLLADFKAKYTADNRSGGIINHLGTGIARGISFGKYGQDSTANSVMTPKSERWAGKIGEFAGASIPVATSIVASEALGVPAAVAALGGGPYLQAAGTNLAAAAIHGRWKGAQQGLSEPDIRRQQATDAATFVPLGMLGEAAGAVRRGAAELPGREAQAWLKPDKLTRDEMLSKDQGLLGDQYLKSPNYKGISNQTAAYNKAVAHMPYLEAEVQTELKALKQKALTPNQPDVAPAPSTRNPITGESLRPGLEYNPTPVEVQPQNPPPFPNMEPRPSGAAPGEITTLPFPSGKPRVPVSALPAKNAATTDAVSQSYLDPKTGEWRPNTYAGTTHIEQEAPQGQTPYPEQIKQQFRRTQALEEQKMLQPTPKQGPNIDLSHVPPEQKAALLDPLIENYRKIPGAGDKVHALMMLRDNPVNNVEIGNVARRVMDDEVGNWYGKPRADAPFNVEGLEVLANDIRGQMAKWSPKMADLMKQYQLDLRVKKALGAQDVGNPRSMIESIFTPRDSLRRGMGMRVARAADFASKFVPKTSQPTVDSLSEVISRTLAQDYDRRAKKQNEH